MLKEFKRVWHNFKYHIILLTVAELFFIIFYIVKKIEDPVTLDNYKEVIIMFIYIILALFFYLFLPIKESISDLELTLPKSRLKLYITRFLAGYIAVLIPFCLFYLFIFPDINFFKSLLILTLFLVLIFATSIYAVYFKKAFLIFFLSSIGFTIIISLIIHFSRMLYGGFLLFFILVHFHIALLIYLVPLIPFFLNYRKNYSYTMKVMIIPFILFIFFIGFYYYNEIWTRFGNINNFSLNNGILYITKTTESMNEKTIFYRLEDKKYAKKIFFGSECYYRNRYGKIRSGKILLEEYNKIYIESKNFNMKLNYFKNNEINYPFFIFHNRNSVPEFIFVINNGDLHRLYLRNFKRELIMKNVEPYKLLNSRILGFKKGKKIFAANYKIGIEEIKYPKLKIIISDNTIFFLDKKKKVILDKNGELFYRSSAKKFDSRGTSFIEDKRRSVILKNKIYEIPGNAKFMNEDTIHYNDGDKIIIRKISGKVIIEDIIKELLKKGSRYVIYEENNEYYLILKKSEKKKRTISLFFQFDEDLNILLIYRFENGKFCFYDKIK